MVEISKKFNLNLDLKSIKPIRDKSLQCFVGDSIELTVNLSEEYSINHAKCYVLYTKFNEEVVQQRFEEGGITIEGNNIKIVPKKSAIDCAGNLTIEIVIYDLDEAITLPHVVFYLAKTSDAGIIDSAKNDIGTLKDLEVAIIDVSDSMDQLNLEMNEIESRLQSAEVMVDEFIADAEKVIADSTLLMKEEIDIVTSELNDEIEALEDKLNGKIGEVDEFFVKAISLEPYVDGSFISFRSSLINLTAKDLYKYSFIYHVSGAPYTNSILTPTVGIVGFSDESGYSKIFNNAILTRVVQGNSVAVVAKFLPNNSTSMPNNEFGYRIKLETNIKAQFINNCKATLSPIGGNLI